MSGLLPPALVRRLGPRGAVGGFLLAGGVVALLLALGSLAVGVAALRAPDAPAPVPLPVGEAVPAPDAPLLGFGQLVVFGRDADVDGSRTLALGCTATTPGGTERRFGAVALDRPEDLRTDQGVLVPLVAEDRWRGGHLVRCDGPEAAASAPLVLAVDQGRAGTAAALALALGAVALLAGTALSAAGLAVLRRRP